MAESSAQQKQPSSSLEALILRKAATVKNDSIGKAIAHDDGHVSRILSGERGLRIYELEAFFSEIGLAVIECSGSTITLPQDELNALRVLARKALT